MLYWKKAEPPQLGIPTFFLTLSCTYLRWNSFAEIIQKLMKLILKYRIYGIMEEAILWIAIFWVEIFFKLIVIDRTLGRSMCFAIRMEFQIRGSPQVHTFTWIIAAPKSTSDNVDKYINLLDKILSVSLPVLKFDSNLYELVKTYQIHRHSKTCWKCNNDKCCFHFGRFFTQWTIVDKSRDFTLSDARKKEIHRKTPVPEALF